MPKNARNQRNRAKDRNNSSAPNRATNAGMTQPRFKPVVKFSRTVTTGFDVVCDGINPSLNGFQFTLSQLPGYTDFTKLFQTYKIDKIKVDWRPEYTELTDAALVSNAINVNFNSCIDQTNGNAPTAVTDVLEYQSCISTGITKPHSRTFIPAVFSDSAMPCHCYVSSLNPTESHYGMKVGVPPTGVAMTFYGTVTFYFTCAGVS